MSNFSTIYKLSLIAAVCFIQAVSSSSRCPVLECWFIQEGRGGLTSAGNQDKALLHIRTGEETQQTPTDQDQDQDQDRAFTVHDPASTLCHPSLNPPKGSVKKPNCEINPFQPLPSTVKWAASLTGSALSPVYLQADWVSASIEDLDGQLVISSVMRAPETSRDRDVVLTVTTRTVLVQARLGEPVLLDCGFWADPSSPLQGSGFAVEWRYQFRGDGRLVLAYDGKTDRLADIPEEGGRATLDFGSLHQKGNASLILREAKVHDAGMYICSVYLPYVTAQVAMELEVVEAPSLSIHPSPLPLVAPGQTLSVGCEASGFAPLSLEMSWEFRGSDGKTRSLGSGGLTGHREAWDGTYSQSSLLDLHTSNLDLGAGGELTCVVLHPGGTRRASVSLHVIGRSSPSVEDSMAMVGVALVLYGLIKVASWTFTGSGSTQDNEQDKKVK